MPNYGLFLKWFLVLMMLVSSTLTCTSCTSTNEADNSQSVTNKEQAGYGGHAGGLGGGVGGGVGGGLGGGH